MNKNLHFGISCDKIISQVCKDGEVRGMDNSEKHGVSPPQGVLKEYLEEYHWTQSDLLKRCQEKGHQITQGSLSKVLSGKKKMSLDECTAFCDALDISADEFLFPERRSTSADAAFFLLSDEEALDAECMTGVYNVFFESTAKEEEGKAVTGTLHLVRDRSRIRAELAIYTAKVLKRYAGFLWRKKDWPVAYIIVKRAETGEVATLALRNRSFTVAEMQGRVAVCLSTSAGEQKDPILQHIALVRQSDVADMIFKENVNSENVEEIVKWLKGKESLRLEMKEDIEFFKQLNKWGGTV